MKIIGHIPIKPHLLKYIIYREKMKPGKPLMVPGSNVISMYLDSILTNKTAVRDDRRDTMTSYTEKLPICFTDAAIKWNQLFFTATRVGKFNNFVYQLMMYELVDRIITAKKLGQQEQVTINKFIYEVDLFEVSFSALKRGSTRFRKKNNYPLFHPRDLYYEPQGA